MLGWWCDRTEHRKVRVRFALVDGIVLCLLAANFFGLPSLPIFHELQENQHGMKTKCVVLAAKSNAGHLTHHLDRFVALLHLFHLLHSLLLHDLSDDVIHHLLLPLELLVGLLHVLQQRLGAAASASTPASAPCVAPPSVCQERASFRRLAQQGSHASPRPL